MYPSCQIPPGPADFSGEKALKSVDSAEWLLKWSVASSAVLAQD